MKETRNIFLTWEVYDYLLLRKDEKHLTETPKWSLFQKIP